MVNKFVGYVAGKIVQSIPKSQKVAPTITSIKPTKDIKGSVKRVYRDEESKRIDKTVASKDKMKTGRKMMREAQKELRKQIDTGRAFKFKQGKIGESTFATKPGENPKEKFKGLIEEGKSTKKFKTGKQLEAEKKAKGGRIGYRRGTPKKETNVQKIKKTFGPKSLGMQSVIYGLDKNPKITAADPKAKFIAANKKKKNV
jgi:hypothetical protein